MLRRILNSDTCNEFSVAALLMTTFAGSRLAMEGIVRLPDLPAPIAVMGCIAAGGFGLTVALALDHFNAPANVRRGHHVSSMARSRRARLSAPDV